MPHTTDLIDVPMLRGVLVDRLHDPAWAELEVTLMAGGRSNPTLLLRSPAGEAVLRRPPLTTALPSAHNVLREHTVLSALRDTDVPVPATLFAHGPDGPLGFPFYVMTRAVGHVVRRTLPEGYADTEPSRRALGTAVVDTLVRLHRIDPGAVGLGGFGRPTGFVERQLDRWRKQWEATVDEPSATMDRLLHLLTERRPVSPAGAIVHGDYNIANLVLDPVEPARVVGVLDWEMSTLGDPLTDLGMLLAYWPQAGDPDDRFALHPVLPVTATAGFPSRRDVAEQYARGTGTGIDDVDWYVAYGWMKLAVIYQGIVARTRHDPARAAESVELAAYVEPRAGYALDVLTGTRDVF